MTSPIGPVPLAAVGDILLQTLFTFNASDLWIPADGNGVVVRQGAAGSYTYGLYDPGGGFHVLSGPSVGHGLLLAPVWRDDAGRVVMLLDNDIDTLPSNVVSPNSPINPPVPSMQSVALVVNGEIAAANYINPAPLGSYSDDFQASLGSFPFFPTWPTDGGTVVPVACLKLDDYGEGNSGVYANFSSVYPLGAAYFNNAVSLDVNVAHVPIPCVDLQIQGTNEGGGPWTFGPGLAYADNYNAAFQVPPYAGNFPSAYAGLGSGYAFTGIAFGGLNCSNYCYCDSASNQFLPLAMAQDSWLAALMGSNGGAQRLFTGNVRVMPTRLKGSATYAQTIWQPGIALNATMDQSGISTDYPECQLASVGFFHDGSPTYYFVLPQDFARLDIIDGPDLLWVSPGGNVYGVYHDVNGLYYFMVGGINFTYQSQVYNFRYPYKVTGN
jgi:hypothetical protein